MTVDDSLAAGARHTDLAPHRLFFALAPIMALFVYLRIPTAQVSSEPVGLELIAPAKDFVGLDNYEPAGDGTSGAFQHDVFAVVTTIIPGLALGSRRSWPDRGGAGRSHRALYFAPVLVPMVPVTLGWRDVFNYQHGILNLPRTVVIPSSPG